MNQLIKLGIVGYGNLGKGVENAIAQNPDMELTGVFSRRPANQIKSAAKVYSMKELPEFQEKIDVMMLCGGSAKDLPIQSIEVAQYFNTVDSFDNHAKIPEYFKAVDKIAKQHKKISLISTGWDPGLFSMLRLLGETVLPEGKTYSFWGKGLSQGHSDALRRVAGVKMAAQYTLPNEEALANVRKGEQPEFKASAMHNRLCFVVLEKDANAEKVAKTIKNMPDYFAPYETEVRFITEQEFIADHQKMPHGGKVLRSGTSKDNDHQRLEFSLELESNPAFTSSVLVAFARAVFKLSQVNKTGAVTPFDVPLGYLSPKSEEELRRELL